MNGNERLEFRALQPDLMSHGQSMNNIHNYCFLGNEPKSRRSRLNDEKQTLSKATGPKPDPMLHGFKQLLIN